MKKYKEFKNMIERFKNGNLLIKVNSSEEECELIRWLHFCKVYYWKGNEFVELIYKSPKIQKYPAYFLTRYREIEMYNGRKIRENCLFVYDSPLSGVDTLSCEYLFNRFSKVYSYLYNKELTMYDVKDGFYIGYGTFLDDESKDIDAIYFPWSIDDIEEIMECNKVILSVRDVRLCDCNVKIKGTVIRLVCGYESNSDWISTEDLKNQRILSHSYYNLMADYGKEFADIWLDAIKDKVRNIKLLSLEEWLDKNVAHWENYLYSTPHPHIWGKLMFAKLQKEIYKKTGKLYNRKAQLLDYLEKDISRKDLLLALEDICYNNDDWSDNVVKVCDVDLQVDRENREAVVTMYINDKLITKTYNIDVDIDVYSATDWEIEEIEDKLFDNFEKECEFEYNGWNSPTINEERSQEFFKLHYSDGHVYL